MTTNFLLRSQKYAIKDRSSVDWDLPTPKSPISANILPIRKHTAKKTMQVSPRKLVEASLAEINIQKAIHKSKEKNFTSQFKKRKQLRYQTLQEDYKNETKTEKAAHQLSKNIFTVLRVVKDMCSQFRLLCEDIKYFFSVQSTIWKGKMDSVSKQMQNNVAKFGKLENTLDKFKGVIQKMNFNKTVPVKQIGSKCKIEKKNTFDTANTQLITEDQKQTTKSDQTNCFMKISFAQSQNLESFSFYAEEPESAETASIADEDSNITTRPLNTNTTIRSIKNAIDSNKQERSKSQKLQKQFSSIDEIINKMQKLTC